MLFCDGVGGRAHLLESPRCLQHSDSLTVRFFYMRFFYPDLDCFTMRRSDAAGAVVMEEGQRWERSTSVWFMGTEATRLDTSFFLSVCCFILITATQRQGLLSARSLSRNDGSERCAVQGHQPSQAPISGWSHLEVRPFLLQRLPPLTRQMCAAFDLGTKRQVGP